MSRKKVSEFLKDNIIISGKRKTAIAKATLNKGEGIVRINKIPSTELNFLRRLAIEEPIRITEQILKTKLPYNISVNVQGGGVESQIEAARLAIARAILIATKNAELKRAFISYDRNLLVADVRRKEQYKPNDSKARAKRQKSYR